MSSGIEESRGRRRCLALREGSWLIVLHYREGRDQANDTISLFDRAIRRRLQLAVPILARELDGEWEAAASARCQEPANGLLNLARERSIHGIANRARASVRDGSYMGMGNTTTANGDKDGVTNQLIARLKSLISTGVLTPGSRLPPERELAPAFGVSRSSLRHALKALEVMGVLTQRVGDGTYLAAAAGAILQEPFELLMLMDGISLNDLLETRLIVEPELAARAAERATVEDLGKMSQTLEISRRGGEAGLIEADIAFHRAIFDAARNPICSRMFSLIHRAMTNSIGLTSRVVDWEHTLGFHRPIYAAIEKRRPVDARLAMIAHLSDARSILERLEEKKKRIDVASMATAMESRPRKRGGGRQSS